MGVEILDNGTRVLTAPGATFGTDALLLARFAQPAETSARSTCAAGAASSHSFGTTPGTAAPAPRWRSTPLRPPSAPRALTENADAAHIAPVCGDLRQLCTAGPEQGQYDFAACNPPYFTAGPRSPDPRRAEARHTGSCTTADAVDCARRLCGRRAVPALPAPGQLAEILAALRAARLWPSVWLFQEPPRRRALAFSRRSPEGPQNRPARRAGHSDPKRRRPLRANYFVGAGIARLSRLRQRQTPRADMESAPTAQGRCLASTRKGRRAPFPQHHSIRRSYCIMGLFTRNFDKPGRAYRPTPRKRALPAFEILGRDFSTIWLAGILAMLGGLPFAAGVWFAVETHSLVPLVIAGVLAA